MFKSMSVTLQHVPFFFVNWLSDVLRNSLLQTWKIGPKNFHFRVEKTDPRMGAGFGSLFKFLLQPETGLFLGPKWEPLFGLIFDFLKNLYGIQNV